jgi:hypothetical protein
MGLERPLRLSVIGARRSGKTVIVDNVVQKISPDFMCSFFSSDVDLQQARNQRLFPCKTHLSKINESENFPEDVKMAISEAKNVAVVVNGCMEGKHSERTNAIAREAWISTSEIDVIMANTCWDHQPAFVKECKAENAVFILTEPFSIQRSECMCHALSALSGFSGAELIKVAKSVIKNRVCMVVASGRIGTIHASRHKNCRVLSSDFFDVDDSSDNESTTTSPSKD